MPPGCTPWAYFVVGRCAGTLATSQARDIENMLRNGHVIAEKRNKCTITPFYQISTRTQKLSNAYSHCKMVTGTFFKLLG